MPSTGRVVIITALRVFGAVAVSAASEKPKSAATNVCAASSLTVMAASAPSGASLIFVKVIDADSVVDIALSSSVAVTSNAGAASPPSCAKLTEFATTSANVKLVTTLPPSMKLPPVTLLTVIVTSASTSSISTTPKSATVKVTVSPSIIVRLGEVTVGASFTAVTSKVMVLAV